MAYIFPYHLHIAQFFDNFVTALISRSSCKTHPLGKKVYQFVGCLQFDDGLLVNVCKKSVTPSMAFSHIFICDLYHRKSRIDLLLGFSIQIVPSFSPNTCFKSALSCLIQLFGFFQLRQLGIL